MAESGSPEEVARRIADEVVRCTDVVALSAGGFGTLVTPAPGGHVHGVAVRGAELEVGLVIRFGRPLPDITAEIRRSLVPFAGGRAVHISVEDVVAGLDDGVRQ